MGLDVPGPIFWSDAYSYRTHAILGCRIVFYILMVMKTAKELLSANIKAKRSDFGLTQEKLAELVNVSYQMIHDIEGCRTWVSDKTLQSLSKAFGVEIYELLCPSPKTDQKSEFNPHLVDRLHKTMKSDIDRRLDDFFGKQRDEEAISFQS